MMPASILSVKRVVITNSVRKGGENELEVRVSHPKGITDMPWVCGGCSSEWGFSEGSQPFGIYRPVVLEVTDKTRIEPYGTHIWNNITADSLFVETEVKNYGKTTDTVSVISKICDKSGKQVTASRRPWPPAGGEIRHGRNMKWRRWACPSSPA